MAAWDTFDSYPAHFFNFFLFYKVMPTFVADGVMQLDHNPPLNSIYGQVHDWCGAAHRNSPAVVSYALPARCAAAYDKMMELVNGIAKLQTTTVPLYEAYVLLACC